ncbi:hypothetical protein K437DRAFT_231212 [Tilletiaria anomala UBC 951]|uniref:Uncharacterized protein n=1 Tax=Tilletiaria anomala (strain ATCC 24038 / CBS 436.72 / UBC 951) TaxID=1037660 RepID=A0A066WQ66_TILAU|nr:uncharacterized protein K437DRAFT_231212 [Tilletiaria anomala UBC 951]KDN53149.1 hypothetical protein K437DRAFT_231212 [Tilletiaria anomala UBC 951]
MSHVDHIHSLALAVVPAARKRRDETESERRARKALARDLEETAWDIVESEVNQRLARSEIQIAESIKQRLLKYAVDGGVGSSIRYSNLVSRLKSHPEQPRNLVSVLDMLDQLSFDGRPLKSSDAHIRMPSLRSAVPNPQRDVATPRTPRPATEPTESAPQSRRGMPLAERVRERRLRAGQPQVPEEELLRDVIYLLQGIDGKWVKFKEMFVMPNDAAGANVIVTEGGAARKDQPEKVIKVIFPQNSGPIIPRSTRRLILQITELGRLYRRISQFTDEESSERESGLATQSLCHFISREMTDYYRLIAILETQLNDSADSERSDQASSSANRDANSHLTLKRVAVWTHDVLLRMRLLSTIIEQCQGAKGGALASLIHTYTFNGDPLIKSMTADLLEEVSRPFFDTLSNWIFKGELQDPFNEFFVQSNREFAGARNSETLSMVHESLRDDDAASFWQHQFIFRADMLPSFLSPEFGRKIFSTGKSLNFIRYACGADEWVSTQAEATLLRYSDIEGLQRTVDSAHKAVSKHLVEIFLTKLKLLDHLQALQDYLMLGKGDFVDLLKSQLEEYLNRPSNSLHRHNLTIALETAIRGSNAQHDDPEVIKRLDARLLEDSAGDTGWDVFTLEYKVDSPVNTILDGPAMQAYQMIFGHLWRIKRAEVALAETWARTTSCRFELQKTMKQNPQSKAILRTLNKALLMLGEMNHMVRQIQGFCQLECAAYSWQDLTISLKGELDLDELCTRAARSE